MAQLAQTEPYTFRAVVEEAKQGLKNAVLKSPLREDQQPPSMLPHTTAPSTVERGHLPKYEGPTLPPYPRRVKHFS